MGRDGRSGAAVEGTGETVKGMEVESRMFMLGRWEFLCDIFFDCVFHPEYLNKSS